MKISEMREEIISSFGGIGLKIFSDLLSHDKFVDMREVKLNIELAYRLWKIDYMNTYATKEEIEQEIQDLDIWRTIVHI